MAFIRHFICVPDLPHEIRDQFNAAEVVEYLTPEKGSLEEGQPIVRMKTWWAVFDVVSTAKGRIEKNLYDNPAIRGCRIKIGEPLSLVFTDPDEIVGLQEPFCSLRKVQTLHEKPKKA